MTEINRPRRRAPRRAVLPMLLPLAAGIAAATPAAAEDFLSGKSKGMKRCVRAILGGYTVKRVNVHGHHFNCLPLRRWDAQRRTLILHRNIRLAQDDSYVVWFKVNRVGTREYVKVNSVHVRILKGLYSYRRLGPYKFRGPPAPGRVARDYDFYAARARRVRPREERNWRTVANQIRDVVLAQLGAQ